MRVLVTGASGLLGFKVASLALKSHAVVAAYSSKPVEFSGAETINLDLLDRKSVFEAVKSADPDTIIHCAAMAGVDECEKSPDKAMAINGIGTESLAMAARNYGAKLVYVSTDYVFSGEKQGCYDELDSPAPINAYGMSKLRGEIASRLAGNYAIARTSVLYGWNAHGGRENIASRIISRLHKGEEVLLESSGTVSPTLAENAADALVRIGESGARGIFHAAGSGQLTRYDFGLLAAEVFGLDKSLVKPATPEGLGWVAKRPANSCLAIEKAEKELGAKMLTPREGLELMKAELSRGRGRWFP